MIQPSRYARRRIKWRLSELDGQRPSVADAAGGREPLKHSEQLINTRQSTREYFFQFVRQINVAGLKLGSNRVCPLSHLMRILFWLLANYDCWVIALSCLRSFMLLGHAGLLTMFFFIILKVRC